MCGVCSTSRSTSVVLPAPDGAETMKSSPRRPEPLLDILDLLAHLLELRLRGDHELGHAQTVGLRAHRVDLAVHLLQQKVELAPARRRRLLVVGRLTIANRDRLRHAQ